MMVKSWSLLVVVIAVFFLLLPPLMWCAVSLVRGNRGDTLVSVSLVGQQEIEVPAAGEFVVMLQMPQLALGAGDIQIELTEKASGHTQTMKYSYAQAQGALHGVGGMQIPFGRLLAPRAGMYVARVSGLDPGKDYSNYRLILSRPYLARMTLQIIGIVFCAVGMLGCLVWAAWLAGLMKPGTGGTL